jgi:hypothetical protein
MTGQMRTLEGRQVSVSLRGGDRIDDCQLVSAARVGRGTVWLFWNSIDVFIPAEDVVDVWEVCGSHVA